jgi:hypothetical protein
MQNDEQDLRFGAYGFLTLVDPAASVSEAIGAYGDLGGVTFANAFVGGSFDGFVAVKSDVFADIQALIIGPARQSGVKISWSIQVQAAMTLKAPHKKFPLPFPLHESLTRIRTAPHRAAAVLAEIDSVYSAKPTEDFGAHAAIVTGKRIDILVELASSSLETIQESIVNDLAPIDGIVASDTSFAFVEG